MKEYEGGCHCGAVRYRVKVREHVANNCNCSICSKKGYLHVHVSREDFELLQGRESLSTYTFNTGIAKHHFCKVCGVHSFYISRSHPNGVDVNLRCLDGDFLGDFTIRDFDGRNWEENIHVYRSSNETGGEP